MKKWLKNNKGLTLVELLAVIVILGVVAAIAVPTINGTIRNSKEQADVASYRLIVDASIRASMDELAADGDGVIGGTIQSLVDDGYLTSLPVAQASDGVTFTSYGVTLDANDNPVVGVYGGAGTANPINITGGKLVQS